MLIFYHQLFDYSSNRWLICSYCHVSRNCRCSHLRFWAFSLSYIQSYRHLSNAMSGWPIYCDKVAYECYSCRSKPITHVILASLIFFLAELIGHIRSGSLAPPWFDWIVIWTIFCFQTVTDHDLCDWVIVNIQLIPFNHHVALNEHLHYR